MLDHVAQRAKEADVANLRTILGEYDDPKLPVKDVERRIWPGSEIILTRAVLAS
jgi:hypothetical protein